MCAPGRITERRVDRLSRSSVDVLQHIQQHHEVKLPPERQHAVGQMALHDRRTSAFGRECQRFVIGFHAGRRNEGGQQGEIATGPAPGIEDRAIRWQAGLRQRLRHDAAAAEPPVSIFDFAHATVDFAIQPSFLC
jgi:hypothetical protein